MFGSRLLFRGHGIGRYTWSVDAALAGMDTLVILDEAHISRPLVKLVEQIQQLPPPEEASLATCRQRPRLVPVSATSRAEHAHDVITLDAADRANPLITQRLDAPKPLGVITTRKPLDEAVYAQIDGARNSFTKAIVFLNTPRAANATAQRLRNSIDDLDVIVATGQMRGFEANNAAEAIRGRLGLGAEPSRPVVVVATQTLEVGADLDADLLITQSCGAAALVQRLGRLNRLGRYPHARAVLIHPSQKQPTDDLYPDIRHVLERLQAAADESGAAAAGPDHIRDTLADLLYPPDLDEDCPVLSQPILHEWVKTTNPPRGEAPVEAFYAGFRPTNTTVEVLWRAHIPEPGEPLWPPPSPGETVEIPPGAARDLLKRNPESVVALADDARTVEPATPDRIRAGSTLIAHSTVGCLDADGHWAPDAGDPVPDVALLNWGLTLTGPTLEAIFGEITPTAQQALDAIEAEEADSRETYRAVGDLVAEIASREPPRAYARVPEWRQFADGLAAATAARRQADRPVVAQPRTGAPRMLLAPPVNVVDAGDGLSFVPQHSALSELGVHNSDTARRAVAAAVALGVPEAVTRIVGLAAEFHDLGKTDPRFQRWLTPGWRPGDTLMAKSHMPRWRRGLARRDAGYPRGGRHEEVSRRAAVAWLEHSDHDLTDDESELLVHLVASHHGRARPLLEGVVDDCPATLRVECRIGASTLGVHASLTETDWEQPARFARLNQRYGPWGLAALEAILRQADWQSSQAADAHTLDVR
jgi:CRISPR-associated endonuclease/helicase Cas3